MIIGGIQKLTLIDYPGKLAATVFLAGCNFRCPFCYNAELVLPEKIKKQTKIPEKDFFGFLKSKKGLLEAVVICGGEPLINKDLASFIKKIKKMGYKVKIDTNGTNPAMLESLIDKKLVDYVAMDIKGPKGKYKKISGGKAMMADVEKSINILKKNKVDCEFRTTVVPGLLNKEDFLEIARWIGDPNVKYYLQEFKPEKTINKKFEKVKPYPNEYLLSIQKDISPFFEICRIR